MSHAGPFSASTDSSWIVIWTLQLIRVNIPNGITIGPAAIAELIAMTNRLTDRQTDRSHNSVCSNRLHQLAIVKFCVWINLRRCPYNTLDTTMWVALQCEWNDSVINLGYSPSAVPASTINFAPSRRYFSSIVASTPLQNDGVFFSSLLLKYQHGIFPSTWTQ